MAKDNTVVWLIRAGRKSEAEPLFLKKRRLGLGPSRVGDLHNCSDREAIKARFREAYPESTNTAVGGGAGQLFRFLYEAKRDDIVVYPSKKDRLLHIGIITSTYQYDLTEGESFPHQRKVRWVAALERTKLSEGFLKEARAFKSFYQISKCAEEVRSLMPSEKSHTKA